MTFRLQRLFVCYVPDALPTPLRYRLLSLLSPPPLFRDKDLAFATIVCDADLPVLTPPVRSSNLVSNLVSGQIVLIVLSAPFIGGFWSLFRFFVCAPSFAYAFIIYAFSAAVAGLPVTSADFQPYLQIRLIPPDSSRESVPKNV